MKSKRVYLCFGVAQLFAVAALGAECILEEPTSGYRRKNTHSITDGSVTSYTESTLESRTGVYLYSRYRKPEFGEFRIEHKESAEYDPKENRVVIRKDFDNLVNTACRIYQLGEDGKIQSVLDLPGKKGQVCDPANAESIDLYHYFGKRHVLITRYPASAGKPVMSVEPQVGLFDEDSQLANQYWSASATGIGYLDQIFRNRSGRIVARQTWNGTSLDLRSLRIDESGTAIDREVSIGLTRANVNKMVRTQYSTDQKLMTAVGTTQVSSDGGTTWQDLPGQVEGRCDEQGRPLEIVTYDGAKKLLSRLTFAY